jgi:hypothetical protein
MTITNTVIENINMEDYPDFCDAFLISAELNGVPLNDQQLEQLNEDRSLIQQLIQNQ